MLASSPLPSTTDRPLHPGWLSPQGNRPVVPTHGLRLGISAAVVAATIALCSAYIFFSIYAGFSEYDDEGGILIVLQNLLSGHVLYDQVPAMYGPAGLLGKWLLLKTLHLPATHDVGRAITGAIWLLTSICCGIAVGRWTRQIAGFVVTTSAVCLVLRGVVREPGHPQDLCGLLLAAMVLLSTATQTRRRGAALVGIGIAGGLLAMVKINLGIFFAAAWVGALLPDRRRLRAGYGLALLMLPVALFRQHLDVRAVRYFLIECECSLLACLIMGVACKSLSSPTGRQRMAALVTPLLTALIVCGLACSIGSSVHGLVDGVLLQPLRVSNLFFRWPPNHLPAIGPNLAGLLLAVAARSFHDRRWVPVAAAGLRVLVGVVMFNLLLQGANLTLIQIAPAFCWTLLLPGGGEGPGSLARNFLALLAVCQSLWIYPVAGTQVAFALLLPTVLLSFGFFEGLQSLLASLSPIPCRRATAALTIGLTLVCFVLDGRLIHGAAKKYHSYVRLDLPGARWVRVETVQRDRLHQIVANLMANGDVSLNLPALNSLHLWSGLATPTLCNPTSFLYLSPQQAMEAAAALSLAHRPCLLWDDTQVRFWVGRSSSAFDTPLMRTLRTAYKPAITHGSWTLLLPRSSETAVCVSAAGVRREVPLSQPDGFALDADQPTHVVAGPPLWNPGR